MRYSVLLALAAALVAGPAAAGNGNTLYLLQQQQGPNGNAFIATQDAADYTSIGTIGQPATQRGSGNSADLRLSGDCALSSGCGLVTLTQDNSVDTSRAPTSLLLLVDPRQGNTATLTLSGTGNAAIAQIGDANTAILDLSGGGNGSVSQTGLGNDAMLTLAGGAGGSITQQGVANSADLNVTGGSQFAVALTQNGTNLSYSQPISVMSNEIGTMTITQSN